MPDGIQMWKRGADLASDWSVEDILASDWAVEDMQSSDWSVEGILASDWLRGQTDSLHPPHEVCC